MELNRETSEDAHPYSWQQLVAFLLHQQVFSCTCRVLKEMYCTCFFALTYTLMSYICLQFWMFNVGRTREVPWLERLNFDNILCLFEQSIGKYNVASIHYLTSSLALNARLERIISVYWLYSIIKKMCLAKQIVILVELFLLPYEISLWPVLVWVVLHW